MKTKNIKIFTFIISTIYIISALIYGVSLALEYKNGPERSSQRFNELTRETMKNMKAYDPSSDEFKTGVLHSIGDMSDIKSLKIDFNGLTIISYPAYEEGGTSPLIQYKNDTLYTDEGRPLKITAAIYLLRPSSVSSRGMIAFFIVLAATLICIFCLIHAYLQNSSAEREEKNTEPDIDESVIDSSLDLSDEPEPDYNNVWNQNEQSASGAPKESNNLDEDFENFTKRKNNFYGTQTYDSLYSKQNNTSRDISYEENLPDPNEDFEVQDSFDSLNADIIDETMSEEDFFENSPEVSEEDVTAAQLTAEEEEVVFSEPTVIKQETIKETPTEETPKNNITQEEFLALTEGFDELHPEKKSASQPTKESKTSREPYSPVTGFSWEDKMIQNVDKALVEATSSEQDLALFTFCVENLNRQHDASKEICEYILQKIESPDKVFEYGEDGFTVVFQNLDIEKSIQLAEDLHTDMIAILAKYNLYNSISIGVSCRTSRIISASRLANESQQALDHAMEDKESPIVAFKVNPEKYRNFLASEQTN